MSFGDSNPYAAPAETSAYPGHYAAGNPLATRSERFAGAFIDGLILLPLMFVVGMVLGVVLIAGGLDAESPAFVWVTTILGGLLGVGGFLLVNGYLLATKGQTVGKLVMKTQIVSEQTDQILPFGRVIGLRYVPVWIASSLPFVGGIFSMINALAIFRGNRKCIHDDIAGTKVIKLLQ